MAEREGFEPPIAFRLCLISSQVHSTGLCHLSIERDWPGCLIQFIGKSCLWQSTGHTRGTRAPQPRSLAAAPFLICASKDPACAELVPGAVNAPGSFLAR